LCPVIERTDPTPIIKAPPLPMNANAESAIGVLERAMSGREP
jgi:hypothetical protein